MYEGNIMKNLINFFVSLVFLCGVGVANADLDLNRPLSMLDNANGVCEFDNEPEDGILPRNYKLSMYGDACRDFEIWVAPTSFTLGEDEIATAIPRAERFVYQDCRYTNVMTDHKITEYAVSIRDENEETAFYGVCYLEPYGIPTGFQRRQWKVDTD